MAEVSDEPVASTSLLGPAVLAAVVMVFAHAAASALLTVLVATATPGPGIAASGWDAAVWGTAVVAAALALRPILRRVARPLATGVVAGLLAAAAYTALSAGLAEPGQSTPLLWARAASVVGAGIAAGLLSRSGIEAREG